MIKERTWILALRAQHSGSQRIQRAQVRLCDFLNRHRQGDRTGKIKPLSRPKLNRKRIHRYEKEIVSERLQMDTCKIGQRRRLTTVRASVFSPCIRAAQRVNTLLFLEKCMRNYLSDPEHKLNKQQRTMRLHGIADAFRAQALAGICDRPG